jgi:hypothetical protein
MRMFRELDISLACAKPFPTKAGMAQTGPLMQAVPRGIFRSALHRTGASGEATGLFGLMNRLERF